MNAVADIFDRNGDGYIDYKEFIASLRPERERSKPVSDTEKIEDEVKSQVAKCTCPQRYRCVNLRKKRWVGEVGAGLAIRCSTEQVIKSNILSNLFNCFIALHRLPLHDFGLWSIHFFSRKSYYSLHLLRRWLVAVVLSGLYSVDFNPPSFAPIPFTSLAFLWTNGITP